MAGPEHHESIEINRRVVLAAAGVGIAAGAASLLVACDKHGEPAPSPTPDARPPGQLDLQIPRQAFGSGQGTYTVLLCNDTLISEADLTSIEGEHALPQRISCEGGQHLLIIRALTGGEWTHEHPVQLPQVDHYEIDSVSVSVVDDGGAMETPPFTIELTPTAPNEKGIRDFIVTCSLRG